MELERLARELEIVKEAVAYGNPLPRRSSDWFKLAEAFEIGIRDLDNIALDLGYHTFRLMDKNVSPKEAIKEKGLKKFMDALRATSLLAYGMNNSPLKRMIQKAVR